MFNSTWAQGPCVQVTGGWYHSLAILGDGSVVAWGLNDIGQCNVPALPPGLTYVEVAAGVDHSVARYGTAICPWYCGSGINSDTYALDTSYVLGGTFQGSVGFSPPNLGVVVVGYLGRLTFPLWGQQGLVDPSTPKGMGLPILFGASPVRITWAVPHEPIFAGDHIYTQAATVGGGVIHLTCAYDCTVGY